MVIIVIMMIIIIITIIKNILSYLKIKYPALFWPGGVRTFCRK